MCVSLPFIPTDWHHLPPGTRVTLPAPQPDLPFVPIGASEKFPLLLFRTAEPSASCHWNLTLSYLAQRDVPPVQCSSNQVLFKVAQWEWQTAAHGSRGHCDSNILRQKEAVPFCAVTYAMHLAVSAPWAPALLSCSSVRGAQASEAVGSVLQGLPSLSISL